jgi:hypothetical protein
MKPQIIVKLEGWIAFLIPFLSAIGGASILSDTSSGKVIALICSALVGGLSGLKSFLSTTFSDSLPETPAVKIATEQAAKIPEPLK